MLRESEAAKLAMLRRYGYANRKRPQFEKNSFHESDLNWYISYSASEDRFHDNCLLYVYGESRSYRFFLKLDDYVSEPIETYDPFKGTIQPLRRVFGTDLEILAQALSKRLAQSFKLEQEIGAANKDLAKDIVIASGRFDDLVQFDEVNNALIEFRLHAKAGQNAVYQIVTLDVTLKREAAALDELEAEIVDKKEEIEAARAPRKGVRIFNPGGGQWRAARSQETGVNADNTIGRLQNSLEKLETYLQIAQNELEYALNSGDSDEIVAAEKEVKRVAASVDETQSQIDQINELRKPTAPPNTGNLIDLVESASELRARITRLTRERASLETKVQSSSSSFSNVKGASYDNVREKYNALILDLRKDNADFFGVNELPKTLHPSDHNIEEIAEQLDDVLTVFAGYRAALAGRMVETQGALQRQMSQLRILDDRQKVLVSDVVAKRLQATAKVRPEIANAGARSDDDVLVFMKDANMAIKQSQKVLDVLTSRAKAVDAGLEASGVGAVERSVVGEINQVLDPLFTVPDSDGKKKLLALKSHVDNAKKVIGLLSKINSYGQPAAKVRADLQNPSTPTLKEAFSYFENIKVAAELLKEGLPIGGQAAGYYLDYIGKSVSAIGAKAQTIQERTLAKSIKLNLRVPPERHLYTYAEVKSELGGINESQVADAAKVLQTRRLIALISARNYAQACNRPLGNNSACLNND